MNESEKVQLGLRVKAFRERKGYTQEQFAEICGSSARTISNIEKGRVVPDLRTVYAFSKYFSISIDDLLRIDTHSKKSSVREDREREILHKIRLLSDDTFNLVADVFDTAYKHLS